jgi:hypothetical protein
MKSWQLILWMYNRNRLNSNNDLQHLKLKIQFNLHNKKTESKITQKSLLKREHHIGKTIHLKIKAFNKKRLLKEL